MFILSGKFYRHYKGGLYEVICTAQLESNRDTFLVVYRSCETGETWARPISEFREKFKLNGH